MVETFKMYTNVTVETISFTRDDGMVTFRVKMVEISNRVLTNIIIVRLPVAEGTL
jgi:hypothetical protein